jgi:hypothetical protein
MYIDFVGGTNPSQPHYEGMHPFANLPSWILSADKKKIIRAFEKLLDKPKI